MFAYYKKYKITETFIYFTNTTLNSQNENFDFTFHLFINKHTYNQKMPFADIY